MAKPILKKKRNARDLGGSYGGVSVRAGYLFRGKTVNGFSKKEVAELTEKYGVKTIIDLRSEVERKELPDMPLPGVSYVSLPVFERQKEGITHDEESDEKLETLRRLPNMERLYRDFLHDEQLKNFAKSVSFIVDAEDSDGGIYFHCTEGKDRTGILAATLFMLLGVSREEIVKDYLKTNDVAKRRARLIYLHLRLHKHKKETAKHVSALFVADIKYLNAFFRVIDEEYESDEDFFLRGLGLSKERIQAFRDRMIEK